MQQESFVPYAGFVSDIKKTYSQDYLEAQHALGVNVRHYKAWDKSDLVALYDSYFGKAVFEHIARLILQARQEEAARAAGSNAYCFAQDDLNEIAPHGLDWKGYEAMMMDAIAEIKATSLRLTRDLAALFDERGDVGNPFPSAFGMRGIHADTGFDPQAALEAMESRMAFQASAPKSTVRDAVASLKNAFNRAAS